MTTSLFYSLSRYFFSFMCSVLQVIKWHNVCSSIHGVMREILLGCEAGNMHSSSAVSNPVLRIHKILTRIRILIRILVFFSVTSKTATKTLF
jgi:hypothetical protein